MRNLILVFTIISSLAVGSAFANDAKTAPAGEPTKGKCCAKAEKNGQQCTHPCCASSAKDGKNCEKCGGTNPAKK